MGQTILERAEGAAGGARRGWRLATVGRWAVALATGAALVVAAVLTVIFAATLALVALIAATLFGLYAVALRARRNHQQPGGPVILEARRVGHSWVAYGWDRRAR